MHIIAGSQKWMHKPSESCRRKQSKNAVLSSFLRTDVLSSQYRVHRKMHNELRAQKIRDEVQRVMHIIQAEQKYPSMDQVLKLVDRSCVSPPLFYLQAY